MSNMSYCRFQNTNGDLADVLDDLERRESGESVDEDGDSMAPLSEREASAAVRLISKCQDVLDLVCESAGIAYDDLTAQDIKTYVAELQADATKRQQEREKAEEDAEYEAAHPGLAKIAP